MLWCFGRRGAAVRARRADSRLRRPAPPDARVELDVLPDAVVETVEVRGELDADRVEVGAQLRSNFGFLCERQSVFDIYAEISNSVLNFGMPQQNLDGT